MSGDFAGKVAVVTGGASGIGRATARLLSERGARVVIADLDGDAAVAAADALEDAIGVRCDVAGPADVDGAVAAAAERYGGLDVMVNNAALPIVGALTDHDPAEFARVLQVNVAGVFHGIRAATPHLVRRGGGVIVSTSSTAGLRGSPMLGAYACSKAAVTNLTQTAALELRPLGIRVNCVLPGFIRTQMLEQIRASFEAVSPVPIDEMVDLRQGRGGEPEDIARALVYLASDAADFVSGTALTVDNAMSASLF